MAIITNQWKILFMKIANKWDAKSAQKNSNRYPVLFFSLCVCSVHCASHSLTEPILWLDSVNLKSNNAPHWNAIASLSPFLLLPLAISHNIHALSSLFLSAWLLQCKFYAYCCWNWCLVRVFFSATCIQYSFSTYFTHEKIDLFKLFPFSQIGKKAERIINMKIYMFPRKFSTFWEKKPRFFMLIHVFSVLDYSLIFVNLFAAAFYQINIKYFNRIK